MTAPRAPLVVTAPAGPALAVMAALSALSSLSSPPARADDEIAWNGSIAGRAQATLPSSSSPASTRDLPIVAGLAEVNLQARGKWLDKRLSLVSDASLFAGHGFFYVDAADDAWTAVYDHDVVENHPRLVISELSLRAELFEHLDVTAGKQRVVWGTGIANNPTDVVNPPRDPTDPNFQRTGVWQLKVDVPLENVTWSAFFAPTVLHAENGLPTTFLWFPDYALSGGGARDDEAHYSAGARLYVLVADTDVNLWIVWSNLDNSGFRDKTRLMGSFSRLLGDEIEVHGELLLQTGSNRVYVDEDCVASDADLVACAVAGTVPVSQRRLDSDDVLPRALAGVRWLPADESVVTVEYVYAADGYDDDELGAVFALQGLLRDRARKGLPVPPPPTTTQDGLPARVGVDLLRKHTLFLNYTKPRIFDDFTVTAGAVVAPEDLSGLLSLNVLWTAREWLQLSSFVFVPTPSWARVSGAAGDDVFAWGAFDASPFAARAVVEARVFF